MTAPPPLPPIEPPPLPPGRRTIPTWVYCVLFFILFVVNAVWAYQRMVTRFPANHNPAFAAGVVQGGLVCPLVAIAGIACIWRRNRSFRGIVIVLFWGTIFLLLLKLSQLTNATQQQSNAPQRTYLQNEARPLTGAVLKDEDLHFSMVIPDGFREYPQGIQFKETKYFYLKGTIGKAETVTIINIKTLDGLLSPDLALNRKRLRAQLPAQSELLTKQWHGLTIDAYTMSVDANGSSILVYVMRVPLKPAAIELAVSGPESKRDELNRLADELLASLEGESNW